MYLQHSAPPYFLIKSYLKRVSVDEERLEPVGEAEDVRVRLSFAAAWCPGNLGHVDGDDSAAAVAAQLDHAGVVLA